MTTMVMYVGDLEPKLELTLTSTTGDLDLTGAEVRVVGSRDGAEIFSRTGSDISVEIVGNASLVSMPWKAGDTAAPGRIDVEVEVTWPGTRPQTFRPRGDVRIVPDLGGSA